MGHRSLRSLARGALLVFGAGVLFGLVAVEAPWPAALVRALAPARELAEPPADTVFVDRDGQVLRHVPAAGATRGDWRPLARHPLRLVQAVMAAEDMRFREHHGVDPRAILRAAVDDLRARRIVSGASTITQQTVRLLEPRQSPDLVSRGCSPGPLLERSRAALERAIWPWAAKAWEAVRALAMDRSFTKDEILEQYLNRAPMPGALRGMAAGARVLLDRDLAELSLAECALLAALPQAPGRMDPRRAQGRERLERRRVWVLDRMLALGWITGAEHEQAVREVPAPQRGAFPFRAPHLVDRLLHALGREPGVHVVKTTLDGRVQALAEEALASHRSRLVRGGARQAACVVLDTATREVLAWVGSQAWERDRLGFNDGVIARRSAGSSLKPFVYAVALEHGMTLATPLADVRRSFATPRGDYDPRNYDRREHGPVLARTALGASLNAAAVEVARRVGPRTIADRLRALALLEPKRSASDLGVGIAIGNVEVTLLDLAGAYATLVCGGKHLPPSVVKGEGGAPARQLIDPGVAYCITDALCDPAPRLLTFGDLPCFEYPFPVAVKTGTSTAYRDAWCVAATPRYVVAVWAGNFNGAPTAGLAGASAAAPVVHDLLTALQRGQPVRGFARPDGIVEREVCAESGDLPGEACPHRITELFVDRPGAPAAKTCTWHRPGAETSTFVGPEFAGWIADRATRGVEGKHRLADGGGGAGGMEITYPHAGDRFVVTRAGRAVEITVAALPARTVPYVRWFLDGDERQTTPPPYRWSWELTRGHHRLLAASPDLASTAVVDVQVE